MLRGASPSVRTFASLAMPTTSRGGSWPHQPANGVSVGPSAPGHGPALMMTTGWVSRRSASLKLRPRRISMPTTSKTSGSTAARYAMKAPWSVGGSNPSKSKSLVSC